MKSISKNVITASLAVVTIALLANSAQAQLNMSEKEHTQTIVWIVEAVTFLTAIAIVFLVWYISRKDRNRKKGSSATDKE